VAVVERQVYTKPGTITQLELPDGSKVWLNDGTTLKYPEKFTGNERRLFVDGEAYFEVKTDPKHPFIVENPMMNTLVTGTSFNINAYSNDKYFEITLVEGKVQLEKNNQQFDLKPGEQIRFDVAKTQINRKNVNPAIYASWINGRLILEDEPLGVAVKKLGRWYNVDFIIADNELFALLLTATFQDEKLEQTLQNIVFALPVKFSIKEELVNNSPHKTIYLMKR
jgi:ferric-dicitrate binding protein FerR (iron transport regulator)